MIKQVIVMRKDLGMRRGKEIAQGSHASISFLTEKLDICEDCEGWNGHRASVGFISEVEREWLEGGFTKICVRVDSEAELIAIWLKAREAKLEVHLITDAGKTEFDGVPTKTCLAIGPAEAEDIDKITGHLKLY